MPFDLQALLSMLGMGGLGGPTTGTQMGGPLPPGGGPAQMQPTPQMVPSSTPSGLAGLFGGGGGGGQGLGPMGLLGAGASMLNASGPGNAGIGSILGSGIGGLLQGGQLDRTNALQQQQQAALARIAEQLMQKPAGAQPTASSMPASGGPRPPVMMGSNPGAPIGGPVAGPPPTIPGGPPTNMMGNNPSLPIPAPRPAGLMGSNPGFPRSGSDGSNPFIAMMLQRRMSGMA